MTSHPGRACLSALGTAEEAGSEIAPGRKVLRITVVETADGTALRLEGRLGGAWVDELREACERHRSRTLDLKGLQGVDGVGLILLRQLVLDGVALQHLSGYLSELLADPP